MNYYQRHLGDYARDAGHLTMSEYGAYGLLLDRVYSTEAPIASRADAYRICRAGSKPERAAVDRILAEFFVELPDGGGFENRRAAKEILAVHNRSLLAQKSAGARWQKKPNKIKGESMRPHSERNATAMPSDSDRNAIGMLSKTPRLQDSKSQESPASGSQVSDVEAPAISEATRACIALRSKGFPMLNNNHPDLIAALAGGVTVEEIVATAEEKPDKGLVYWLATAVSRRTDAARRAGWQSPAPVVSSIRRKTIEELEAADRAAGIEL